MEFHKSILEFPEETAACSDVCDVAIMGMIIKGTVKRFVEKGQYPLARPRFFHFF